MQSSGIASSHDVLRTDPVLATEPAVSADELRLDCQLIAMASLLIYIFSHRQSRKRTTAEVFTFYDNCLKNVQSHCCQMNTDYYLNIKCDCVFIRRKER